MIARHPKKGWKIALIIFVLFLFFLFFLPTIIAHYSRNKLMNIVEEKSIYHLEISDMSFVGWHGLAIKSIKIRPKLDKKTFNEEVKYNSDWITLEIESIQLEGIDWRRYFSEKVIFCEQIIVTTPTIYAYRDKTLPNAPFAFKALPARILRESKVRFTVPRIEFVKGKVIYEEVPPKGGEPLNILFNELYGILYHLSSDSVYYQEKEVSLDAKGKMLDHIDSRISYSFKTTDKMDKFSMEGHTGPFEASLFNQYVIPQASLKITSGHVDSLWFKMEADNNESNGILHLGYHDLKMEAKPKKKPKKLIELKTLAAKLFVKEKNIPYKNEELGHIHFERTKDRFLFNYIWNSFKSGVATVVLNVPDHILDKKLKKQKSKKNRD